MMIRTLFLALSLAATAVSASAMQSLIPAPYPSTVPGGAPLDPETPEPGAPQKLMRDPYPQIMGDQSQGNPPIARAHRRQHLIPSLSQRKYRVDRP